MHLKKHFNKLWNQSLKKFRAGQFEYDSMIDADKDSRYGVTLLARPSAGVKQRVCETLQQIKAVAPHQYYYPDSDLHITILSIISCTPEFSLQQINIDDYKVIIDSAVQSISPFKITFRGLTASPSCILIRGFPEGNQLKGLRNELRTAFKASNLRHSIDERYRLQTAHMTAIRFRQPLAKPEVFINKIADVHQTSFGSCMITEVEFAGNDWYQRKEEVKPIQTYNLA